MLLSSLPALRYSCKVQAVLAICLAILLQNPASTQQSTVQQKSASNNKPSLPLEQVLDTDVRLNKKVTVDATAIPVEELLQQISDAQVTLVAGRDCQGWKLQAHLRQRSLKTLMQALAEMLPGTWRPLTDGHTYRLQMTDVAQRRRQRWWDLLEGERARALAAQSEAVLRWMRSAPNPPSVQSNANQQDADTAAANAYVTRQHNFFNLLTPELQQQIAQNLNDAPYYSLSEMQFGSDDMDNTISVPFASLPASAQTMLAQCVASVHSGASGIHADQGNPADALPSLNSASVFFANGGFSLNAGVSFADGSSLDGAFNGGPAVVPQIAIVQLDQSNLPQVTAKMGRDAPATWRELAAFQSSHVWPNHLPEQPRRSSGISRAAQLRYISMQSGMEYLADYYTHGGHDLSDAAQKQPLQQPLTDELNNLAAWRDVSWKQTKENLYLIRNNRWYRDDRLEVSQPLLRKWYSAVIALHSTEPTLPGMPAPSPLKIQMEWEAEIVSSLTRWQIMNGLTLFMPEEEKLAELARNHKEPQDTTVSYGKHRIEAAWLPPLRRIAANISHHYHVTLFYAHLDAEQREAVLTGQLSFNSLSEEQQQKAFSLIPALRREVVRAEGKPIRLHLQPIHKEASPNLIKGFGVTTRLTVATTK